MVDPTETLADLLGEFRALRADPSLARDGVAEALSDLTEWWDRGGFPPDVDAAIAKVGP